MTHSDLSGTAAAGMRHLAWDAPRLLRRASPWGLGLLLALAGWLLVRRAGGALAQPLGRGELLVTALLLSGWSGAVRWGWIACQGGPSHARRFPYPFAGLATAGVLAFAWALSLPATAPGDLTLFWGTLVALEIAASVILFGRPSWRLQRWSTGRDPQPDRGIGPRRQGDSIGADRSPYLVEMGGAGGDERDAGLADDEVDELLAADEWQRISRVYDSRRGEVVSGLMRCAFAPGERQHDVHLAFCPPLRHAPQFSVEQVEGPPARVRVSLVESFGVGVEIKLISVSSEPASVQVQFFACEEAWDDESH